MSNKALTWAFEVEGLKSGAKFVLVALADLADERHSCFPGVPTIAERTGMSESAVRANLDRLIEAGLVAEVRRHRRDGARTSNRYFLAVDGPLAPDSDASDDDDLPSVGFRGAKRQNLGNLASESGGAFLNPQKNPKIEPPLVVPPVAESDPPAASAAAATKPRRGSRIPDEFYVTGEMREWAGQRVPQVDVRRETEKFVLYWRAKSGRDATKLDWTATWRVWMLNAAERTGTPAGRPTPTNRLVGVLEAGARLQAEADARNRDPRALGPGFDVGREV